MNILPTLFLAYLGLVASTGTAQNRDGEIFGEEDSPSVQPPSKAEPLPPTLMDSITTGGLIDLNWFYSKREKTLTADSALTASQSADLFFDNRPTPDYRAFLRLRATASDSESAQTGDRIIVDEAWLRWDAKKSVFFTLGRQHLKWGTGRFWNPTDFLARTIKNPFASRDLRLGQDLFKVHIPSERRGFNYYLIANYSELQTPKDAQAALRGEFALGGIAEISLTAAARPGNDVRYGSDFSSALGPIDFYVEAAALPIAKQKILQGKVDIEASQFPVVVDGDEGYASQALAGLNWTWKYSDQDSLTLGMEYFDNGFGSDNIEDEIFALINGIQKSLYLGMQYGAASLYLPSPGNMDDFSFLLLGIQNLSDQSHTARLVSTWAIGNGISWELSASRCDGPVGELCFFLPESYVGLITNESLPAEMRQRLAALPRTREQYTIGTGVSAKF